MNDEGGGTVVWLHVTVVRVVDASLPIVSPADTGQSTHHRTGSLPSCPVPPFEAGAEGGSERPRVHHGRTHSAPLTGEELDKALYSRTNGTDGRRAPWLRRASTGTRLAKLSPAHTTSMYTPTRPSLASHSSLTGVAMTSLLCHRPGNTQCYISFLGIVFPF